MPEARAPPNARRGKREGWSDIDANSDQREPIAGVALRPGGDESWLLIEQFPRPPTGRRAPGRARVGRSSRAARPLSIRMKTGSPAPQFIATTVASLRNLRGRAPLGGHPHVD